MQKEVGLPSANIPYFLSNSTNENRVKLPQVNNSTLIKTETDNDPISLILSIRLFKKQSAYRL